MQTSKSAMRAMKNMAKGYSEAEVAVRTATSNDHSPPNAAQMHEIAMMSYNAIDLPDILDMLDKRLNDKGKNWRHVYKSLALLDYLLHTGAPSVASYFRKNIYLVKTLTEFQHYDDMGRDVGGDVRARARDVARLLSDENRLAEARLRRRQMRDRMQGRRVSQEPHLPPRPKSTAPIQHRPSRDEEENMKLALKLSKQEEEERQRRLAELAKQGLFDDAKETPQDLIDLSDTPTVSQLQPQFTQLQPQYTSVQPQFTSFQPQFTSVQPQHTQMPLQPQYTQMPLQTQFTQMQPQYTAAYDPYSQQAQYDAMLQAEYARQQAEAQTQVLQWQQQQAYTPTLLSPQTTALGSNNPFATPAMTSNNPFASSPPPRPASSYSDVTSFSTASTPAISHRPPTTAPFSAASTPALSASRPSSAASSVPSSPPRTPASAPNFTGPHSRLSRVFASKTGLEDGLDTFGNIGALRFGPTANGRIVAQRTGVSAS